MFGARLLLLLIILSITPSTVSAVTLHGTVYEWSTFEPLDNALVEINSTPLQFRVATSGVYSFNLPPGDYCIKASYFSNDTLVYYFEDNITVTDVEGDFVFDILMFPLQEEEEVQPDEDIGNITLDISESTVPFDNGVPHFGWIYTVFALIVLLTVAGAAYYHFRRGSEANSPLEPQTKGETQVLGIPGPLPHDLQEIIGILEECGGRITQKDLRKRLNCSEAKVSLMITDLEARGLVQKIKKGRGNIILLTRNNKKLASSLPSSMDE